MIDEEPSSFSFNIENATVSFVGPERCRRREIDLNPTKGVNGPNDFPDLCERRTFLVEEEPVADAAGDWLNNLLTAPL